jgi:glycosyltransferase involved in cell wall biosynthesis
LTTVYWAFHWFLTMCVSPASLFMVTKSNSFSILLIAPFPPPVTGHSIADMLLLDSLKTRYTVRAVDLSIGSAHDGTISLQRIYAVINVLIRVFASKKDVDVAYLTISESIAGNIKDLIILWLLRGKVPKLVLHLHGGSFKAFVLDRSWFLRKLNKLLLSQVHKIVVTGKTHEKIFAGIVSRSRLAIVPNFALEYLFTTPEQIRRKFESVNRICVLYVSSMDQRKGYTRVLDAYLALPPWARSRLRLDFAGRFKDPAEQTDFEQRIEAFDDISYHGIVHGNDKRDLFEKAHVFCLPTAYLEGQPLAILEAYASGCVVLTTPQPGILDIFQPGVNGQLISQSDNILLEKHLASIAANPALCLSVALENLKVAERDFHPKTFIERMTSILV